MVTIEVDSAIIVQSVAINLSVINVTLNSNKKSSQNIVKANKHLLSYFDLIYPTEKKMRD